MSLLTIENLDFKRGGRPVLDGLCLALRDGERIGISGPSGCGKTTLLRVIAGLERPAAGKVAIGELISNKRRSIPPHQRGISMVFQNTALWSHLTVGQNLAFSGGVRDSEMPDRLGIGHLMARRPHELSGGEARRVAVARALLHPHRLLLMDEPLANLPPEFKTEILALIKKETREKTAGLIYVSHDTGEFDGLVNKRYILRGGKLHEP